MMHCSRPYILYSNATSDSAEITPPSSSPTSTYVSPSSSISRSASSPSSYQSSGTYNVDVAASDQERSLYNPKILEPFMGLKQIDHKDDPWHHKPYNLYQPIFTGGGTFESLLNRYRRNVSSNLNSSPNVPSNTMHMKHVLTPEMLERLLRIKMNFEKNYPFLYKTMMGHLSGDKHTTLSITPPEIPEYVSYPNVELAAAEINQLETLLNQLKREKYQRYLEQQLQENIEEDAHSQDHQPQPQHQAQAKPQSQYKESLWFSQNSPESAESLVKSYSKEQAQYKEPLWLSQNSPDSAESSVNSYSKEQSFWDEIQKQQQPKPVLDAIEPSSSESQREENSFWQQFQDRLDAPSSVRKRESFWSALEAAEERENQQRDRQLADDLDRIFNFDEEDTD